MSTAALTSILAVFFMAFFFIALSNALDRSVRAAIEVGRIQPITEVIDRKGQGARPGMYHRAIKLLWGAGHREMATDLIRLLAQHHAEELIAQYWLQQAMTVEPALARNRLGEDFLKTHFRPDLASQCGPAG